MLQQAGKATSLALAALLTVTAAACGDDSSDGASGLMNEPGPNTDDSTDGTAGAAGAGPDGGPSSASASLRRIGSCDEVAAVLNDYIAGFGEGTLGFNVEEQRFDCPWTREPDPEGERIYSVAVSGIYTNTPDFADNEWEAAGLEILEDERVASFGGVLLLQDLSPMGRTVMIEAPGFSLQLSTNGSDTAYLPIDEMTDLMLELIDH